MNDLKHIDLNKTPKHIAIIMDGNGRWAKKHGQERLYGHGFGVESVRETLKAAKELKVEYLTLYAFSTENWNRPKEEVDGLMDLLVRSIANEVDELNESNVRLTAIGDLAGLPNGCQQELESAMEKTASNTGITLVLALNYSARWEILNAVQQIAKDVQTNSLPVEAIQQDLFSDYLSTKSIPDPELLIRTSGEHRVSNFLLWQIAYTEFHFSDVLWPDFKKEHLYEAVIDFQNRERRFGKISEQIQS